MNEQPTVLASDLVILGRNWLFGWPAPNGIDFWSFDLNAGDDEVHFREVFYGKVVCRATFFRLPFRSVLGAFLHTGAGALSVDGARFGLAYQFDLPPNPHRTVLSVRQGGIEREHNIIGWVSDLFIPLYEYL